MVFLVHWPVTLYWLLWSQIFFVVAALIWLFILVPIQIKQARFAKVFAGLEVGDEYRQLSRQWLICGLISTESLVMATWFMIAKPASGFY